MKKVVRMFDVFARYLSEKGGLTEEELQLVKEVSREKKLRKRQYLLQEGDISNHNNFVVRGCLRLYRLGNDGEEHIMRFAIENWWINDFSSFQSGEPSQFNIDALEDSELVRIEKNKFRYLIDTIPNFRQLIDRLMVRNFEATQSRLLSSISDTAEEKYDRFLLTYPSIFERVSLQMVASFLGISRETLSRIRQNKLKK